jgi:putative FmdB family regulatory protein
MPFYEYQCRSCGHQLEVLQKISDKPLRKCPACGSNALVKLVSAPVFRLKGSGWYETDFKSGEDKKRNLAAADGEAPAAKSEDAAKSAESSKAADANKGEASSSADKAKAASSETSSTKPAADKPSGSRSAARTQASAKAARPVRRGAAGKTSRR